LAILAHRGAADESLGILLLFAAMWFGWAGWSRLRGHGFERLPAIAGPGLMVVGGVLLGAALVVPPALFPPSGPAPGPRPASTASLTFEQPEVGASVEDRQLEVVLDLDGGTIVDGASADLAPNTGHIHLSLDGRLVSMTYGVVQVVDVGSLSPGEHDLRAEFVAADHAPFSPRVVATVSFRTEGRT
jgi:hypothetical protein